MKERIIINFPTNIGDSFMALPVLDGVRSKYPKSRITAVASGRTKDFFLHNDSIDEVILFDKSWKIGQKIAFGLNLRGNYDIIIDLKNSMLPLIIGAKKRTPFVRLFSDNLHDKDFYLKIAGSLCRFSGDAKTRDINIDEKEKWPGVKFRPSLFVSCASLSSGKRYSYENLRETIHCLLDRDIPMVVLGEEKDRAYYGDILKLDGVLDLVGKTAVWEVYSLVKKYCRLLLCVDSGIMHLGSYLNVPIVALFGPSDPKKSGPWSKKFVVVKNDGIECGPCGNDGCEFDYRCMKIDPGIVVKSVEKLWQGNQKEY